MADPITLGLLGLGVARAGAGIAQGVGQARAARALELTESQRVELRELQRRRRAGELGLTGSEEATLRAQFEQQQMGAARQLEGMALQQQAQQQGLGRAVTGRDIFLQEQAEQQTLRGLEQQEQVEINRANEAARQEELATIQALEVQRKNADAALRTARANIVAGALGGAADVGSQALNMAQETKMAEAQVPKLSDLDLLRLYGPVNTDRTYGGLVTLPA